MVFHVTCEPILLVLFPKNVCIYFYIIATLETLNWNDKGI